MKIEIEMKYPFGTTFYGVEAKSKNAYRPCPTCGNERKIKAVAANGTEHLFDCPTCTGKQIKGDEKKAMLIYNYSLIEFQLDGFTVKPNGIAYVKYDYSEKVTLFQFEEKVANVENIDDYCAAGWSGGDKRHSTGKCYLTTNKIYIENLIKQANKSEKEKERKWTAGE